MSDICVAYWSGTGNTEAMAQAIGAGITAAGKSADVVPMETISPADLKDQAVWVPCNGSRGTGRRNGRTVCV